MVSYNVTFINEKEGLNRTIQVPDDKYILDAAEERGIKVPFSCRAGACSSCACRLERGDIDQSDQSFLDKEQLDSGYVLMCMSYPTSDCVIKTHQEESLFES
tara:strand:+ start:49 stop:354 length:306 start_codon:yes stop_codon:yes gene_type:complete